MGEFSGGLHGRKTPRPGGAPGSTRGALLRAPRRAIVVGFFVAAMAMAAVGRAAAAQPPASPTLKVAPAHDAATGAKLHGEAAGAGWTDTGDAGGEPGAKLGAAGVGGQADAVDANATYQHDADVGGSAAADTAKPRDTASHTPSANSTRYDTARNDTAARAAPLAILRRKRRLKLCCDFYTDGPFRKIGKEKCNSPGACTDYEHFHYNREIKCNTNCFAFECDGRPNLKASKQSCDKRTCSKGCTCRRGYGGNGGDISPRYHPAANSRCAPCTGHTYNGGDYTTAARCTAKRDTCPTSRKFTGYGPSTTANDPICVPWAGACAHGDLAAQDSRRQDDHCGSCDKGYRLDGRTCKQCAANMFQRSSDRFTGDTCTEFAGSCKDGYLHGEKNGNSKSRRSDDDCESCKPGFHMERSTAHIDANTGSRLTTCDPQAEECIPAGVYTCKKCPAGQEQPVDGAAVTACKPFTGTCDEDAGYARNNAGLRGNKAQCASCRKGYKLEAWETTPQAPFLKTDGADCIKCPSHQHQDADTFKGKECEAHTGVCANGVTMQPNDRTHDKHCQKCNAGFYLDKKVACQVSGRFDKSDCTECKQCADGMFKTGATDDEACAPKKNKGDCNVRKGGVDFKQDNDERTSDDTHCQPQCSPGEGYITKGDARPMLDEKCETCPLNSYQSLAFPHAKTCVQCLKGTFTSGTGEVSIGACTEPNVRTYRSTHRVWFFFDETLKANSDCVRTSISVQDSSETAGASAARNPAFSPMCGNVAGKEQSIVTAFKESNAGEAFVWAGFPLDIQKGDFLVVDMLPGQAVQSTFTTIKSGAAQPPLQGKSLGLCGCIDYLNVLPEKCKGVVMISVQHSADKAAARTQQIAGTAVWDVSTDQAASGVHLAYSPAEYSIKQLHISSAPYSSFACLSSPYTPSEDLVYDKVAAMSPPQCADECSSINDCRGYAFVGDPKQCTLYYPKGTKTLQNQNPQAVTTDAAFPTARTWLYCAKKLRGQSSKDMESRYRVSGDDKDRKTLAVADVPAVVDMEKTTVQLLKACTQEDLSCKGAPCTLLNVMAALSAEIQGSAAKLLHSTQKSTSAVASTTGGVQFGCAKSSGGANEDCVPPRKRLLSDLEAGYFFHTDQTGRPDEFYVKQWLGEMQFQWTDYSSCEQAFSVSRKAREARGDGAWGKAESFDQDYYVQGATTCGEVIKPEGYSDDLSGLATQKPKRKLGTQHRYCVEATSENGAAGNTYKSSPNCAEVQVHWEALVVGKVVSKGTIAQGVAGVEVKWELKGPSKETSLKGTVKSSAAGRFEIHVRDLKNEIFAQYKAGTRPQTETADLEVIVSKGTDTFTCEDGVQVCGGKDTVTGQVFPEAKYKLVAEYLKFQYDELDVVRIQHAPIVPFDGRVAFPLTHHVFAAGDGTSTLESTLPSPFDAGNSKCYIKAARVCAHDYDLFDKVIKCTNTNSKGEYHIPVAVHTRVRVAVDWKSHVFVLAEGSKSGSKSALSKLVSPEPTRQAGVEVDIVSVAISDTDTRHVDLVDVSGQIVTLGAHATQCGMKIGTEALFRISVEPREYVCESSPEMTVVVPTSVLTHTRVMLPGHDIQVTLDAVEPAWPEVTDASDKGYFTRVRNRTRDLKLVAVSEKRIKDAAAGGGGQGGGTPSAGTAEPVERYEYHPKPKLEIKVQVQDAAGELGPAMQPGAMQPGAKCKAVTARDVQSDVYMTLAPGDAPTWIVEKGARMSVSVNVFEEVDYRRGVNNAPQACSWVELQQDTVYPAIVKHVNELGLSNEDLGALANDETTAEYKLAATVFEKTLGDPYPAKGTPVDPALSKCNRARRASDPDCTKPVERDEAVAYADSFGSDHRCAVSAPGAKVATGFSPVNQGAEDYDAVCAHDGTWSALNKASRDAGEPEKYRSWPSLEFADDLSASERGYWQTVGVDETAYEAG